jgi:hypothetical protein
MFDCQIIAFAITGESLGIDSEAFFGLKSKANIHMIFPILLTEVTLIAGESVCILILKN